MNKFNELYDELLEKNLGVINNDDHKNDDFDEEETEAEIEDASALYLDDEGNEYSIEDFIDDEEIEESDDSEDDDDDDDDDDDELDEALKKKKVVRGGKRLKKFVTNKKGFKVKMVKGRAKEVRMKPDEIRKRKKAAKKAARKKKGRSTAAATRKRAKSMKKRSGFS